MPCSLSQNNVKSKKRFEKKKKFILMFKLHQMHHTYCNED